jgi:hypothetical protein
LNGEVAAATTTSGSTKSKRKSAKSLRLLEWGELSSSEDGSGEDDEIV